MLDYCKCNTSSQAQAPSPVVYNFIITNCMVPEGIWTLLSVYCFNFVRYPLFIMLFQTVRVFRLLYVRWKSIIGCKMHKEVNLNGKGNIWRLTENIKKQTNGKMRFSSCVLAPPGDQPRYNTGSDVTRHRTNQKSRSRIRTTPERTTLRRNGLFSRSWGDFVGVRRYIPKDI